MQWKLCDTNLLWHQVSFDGYFILSAIFHMPFSRFIFCWLCTHFMHSTTNLLRLCSTLEKNRKEKKKIIRKWMSLHRFCMLLAKCWAMRILLSYSVILFHFTPKTYGDEELSQTQIYTLPFSQCTITFRTFFFCPLVSFRFLKRFFTPFYTLFSYYNRFNLKHFDTFRQHLMLNCML